MFLYESHLGGVYYTEEPIDPEHLYCESCRDSDFLIGRFNTEEELKELLAKIDYCSEEYLKKVLEKWKGEYQ